MQARWPGLLPQRLGPLRAILLTGAALRRLRRRQDAVRLPLGDHGRSGAVVSGWSGGHAAGCSGARCRRRSAPLVVGVAAAPSTQSPFPPEAGRHCCRCREQQYEWPPDPVWTESNCEHSGGRHVCRWLDAWCARCASARAATAACCACCMHAASDADQSTLPVLPVACECRASWHASAHAVPSGGPRRRLGATGLGPRSHGSERSSDAGHPVGVPPQAQAALIGCLPGTACKMDCPAKQWAGRAQRGRRWGPGMHGTPPPLPPHWLGEPGEGAQVCTALVEPFTLKLRLPLLRRATTGRPPQTQRLRGPSGLGGGALEPEPF